jgi:hypothetical protein
MDAELHCFTNGTDTIVAEDLSHAISIWREIIAENASDDDFDPFEQVPDNKLLIIGFEDELDRWPVGDDQHGIYHTATASAWANCVGKGFLCSTEY